MYQEILDYMYSLANPEIAEYSQRFFKTGKGEYGFGDKFLGIRVPIIRKAVKKYKDISLETAEKILKSEYHEIRMFALLFFVLRFSKADNKEQIKIYNLYLQRIKYINNWDLIDTTAPHIVGGYLPNKDRSILYDLVKSNSLWERRIAIVATLYFIRNNQFQDTIKLAKQLLEDKEDLIHKATGWALSEVGKKDVNLLISFLSLHYKKMPRTMLRYSIEKFGREDRAKYLQGIF